VDSVIGKIDLAEDEKNTILIELLKIKNEQIIDHITPSEKKNETKRSYDLYIL
jgi:hypothetical protein